MISSFVYGLCALAMYAQTEVSVLYFHSAQCEPCRQMEKSLVQLQQQGWSIRAVEAPKEMDLARQFQIKNLPTLVVVSGDKEVDRVVGVASFDQLNNRLSRVAGRSRSAGPSSLSGANNSGLVGTNNTANAQPSASMVAPTNNQPIVRGQSPGGSSLASRGAQGPANQAEAFPLLAANSNSSSFNTRPSTSNIEPTEPNVSLASASSQQQLAASSLPAGRTGAGPARNIDARSSSGSIESSIARASDATVRIKVEESNTIAHGTGTIVAVHGQEGLVLTCGHLFRDMLPGSRLTVDLFAGTPRQVNLVAELIDFKAEKEDIALLSVKLPVQVEPVPILPKGEVLQVGQAAFSFGCDHGNNPTRRDTRVTRINRYLGPANVEIEGAPAVGRSGGGLFDMQGRLIGVCNAASKEDNEGIYASSDVIYTQLSRVGHSHLFDGLRGSADSIATGPAVVPASMVGSSSTGAAGFSNTPNSAIRWPDEDPRLALGAPNSKAEGFQPQVNQPGASAVIPNQLAQSGRGANQPAQLICVMRDGNGNEQVVTINQPSPALIETIQRQGVVGR